MKRIVTALNQVWKHMFTNTWEEFKRKKQMMIQNGKSLSFHKSLEKSKSIKSTNNFDFSFLFGENNGQTDVDHQPPSFLEIEQDLLFLDETNATSDEQKDIKISNHLDHLINCLDCTSNLLSRDLNDLAKRQYALNQNRDQERREEEIQSLQASFHNISEFIETTNKGLSRIYKRILIPTSKQLNFLRVTI